MKKTILFLITIIIPLITSAQLIHSTTATSRLLTTYTSGASNDSIFIFCKPTAISSITASGSGGTAPYTFKWYYYNSNNHQYPLAPFQTNAAVATATATNLSTGGYKLVITDAFNTVVGCDYAWVWNINLTIDAGSDFNGCGPFSLAGTINTNSTTTLRYYNPPADQLIIDASTVITVCFTAVHTYVSDLAFHLIGPPTCGSPDILLSPNPGNNGQSNVCNFNNDVNNLCFTTVAGSNFDPCNQIGTTNTTSLFTGTYSSYGPAGGTHTPINWSPLYGCNASNGGFTLQIWDCVTLDVGALTFSDISFTGAGTCGTTTVTYSSGVINSAINDGACSAATASTYNANYPVNDTTPIILTDNVTFAWSAVPAFTIPNATTSLTPTLNPNPFVNTKFYLTVNGNYGCPKLDSVQYTYNTPATPTITAVAPLCSNASAVTLSASPSGGTFSGSGVAGSTFNPSGLSGNITITYSVGSGGCAASNTSSISVTPYSVATFSYTGTPYCQNASNPSPTFSGGGIAGTFTSSAGLVFVSSATGVVNLAASTAGTYTVTNTIAATGACPVFTATSTITITQVPVATFSYVGGTFCRVGGTNPMPTYSGGGSAGTFTSSPAGLTLNASTGQVTNSTSTVGTYTVTNTIVAAGGCAATTATATITIISSQIASFSYVSTPYCQFGANPSPTMSGGAVIGTFTSSPAGLTFVSSATGVVDVTATTPASYTVTNTIPATIGCPSISDNNTIAITERPVATFNYPGNPFCLGAGIISANFIGAGQPGTFSTSSPNLVVDVNTADLDVNSSLPGTYWVYNLLPAADGCPDVVDSTQVTITTGQIATFNYAGSPYCQGGTNSSPTFTGGGIGGTFTSTAGLVINSSGVVNLSASSLGTYTVTNSVPAAGGCAASSASNTITIIAGPVGTFSYTASPYCQSGANPSPTYSGGGIAGTFTSSPAGLTINAATGLVTLSTSTANTYTVTNTIAAAGGCPQVTATNTITITATPVATFSYTGTPYCSNGVNPSPTFSGGGVAGTFTSSPAGLTINAATGLVTLSTSTAGTYTVTNTVTAGGCPNVVATATITITHVPVTTFSYTGTPYCQTGVNPSPTYSGGGVAGTFTSSPAGLTINSSTGLVTLSTSTAGTYTVTNIIAAAGGCGIITSTASITITAPPVATFSYTGTPYCSNGVNPSPTFSGGGIAGTFTSSPAGLSINAVTGLVTLSTSTAGTYTITNTVTASGCANVVATSTITITQLPVATFSYTGSPYCQTGVNPSPTFSGGGVAGTFTSSPAGLTINPVTGLVTLSTSTAGTYTVTNTIAAAGGCGIIASTASITITAPPVATFSYTGTPYCSNGVNPSPTFSGGGVAGTFTSSPAGLSINAVTGLVTLSTSTAGTYTVTNTIAASGGCGLITATSTITITQLPVATFSYTASPYCQSGVNPSPTFSGGGVAGTFTSSPAGLTINPATGLVTLSTSTAGTYTVTNTIAAAGGCAVISSTSTITITATPVASFSYTGTPYCITSSDPSPTYSGGGIAGTFTSSPAGLTINSATGLVTLSTSTAGTYTVTNTVLASGCPNVVATNTITITQLPVATFTYTGTPYCQNGIDPSPTFSGGGIAGTFTSSPAGLTINAATGLVTLSTSIAGTYTVTNTIAASGGCGVITATLTITITATPVASFSYTGTPYCITSSDPSPTYSGGGIAGIFTSSPAGLIINSATGLVTLSTSTSGTYTVTNTIAASGGCGVVTATSSITITQSPVATFSYIGSPYCPSGANPSPTFSGGGVAGTFSSTLGLNFVSTSTGVIDLTTSTPGTYTVTNTIAASGGCPAVFSTATITILTTPVATFSYALNPYCSNAANPMPTYSGGGIAGTFTSTAGLNFVSSSTGEIDLTTSLAGTYTVTNTVLAGACPNVVATATVTITALPVATFSYAGSPHCQSGSNPVPTLSGVAGTFTSTIGLNFISSSTGVVDLTTSLGGTYTVTNTVAAVGGCPQVLATATITIIATPVATFSYALNPYCSNAANPMPTFSGGGIAGTFTSTAGVNFVLSTTGEIDLTTSLAGTYTITNTVPVGGCPSVIATATVTITALPVATFNYSASPYCQSAGVASPVYSGGGVAGVFTSSPAGLTINSATGDVTPSTSTGGIIYTVTNTIAAAGGCAAVIATDTISVITTPVATFSYTGTPYCQSGANPSPTFSGGGIAGTFTSTVGLVIDSVTGIVDLAASTAGTYTVTNTLSALLCPSVPVTATITITAVPVATFSYTGTPYCQCCANPLPTFSGGGVAGVFTATAGLAFVSNTTGLVDLCTSGVGSYTVTNTIAAAGGCAAVTATSPITINSIPVGTFSYTGITYCAGGSNPSPTLSGGGVMGIFTSTAGLVIDSVTGIIDIAASTIGTYIVTNTPAPNGPCASVPDTAIVNIIAAPVATFNYTGSPFCQNAANPTVTFTGGGTGGTFTSTGGLIIDAVTGTVTLVGSTPGFYTITNTIAAVGGCAGVSATDTMTILATPVATFSYSPNTFCVGSANASPVFSGGGVAGAFTSTAGLVINAVTGVIDLTLSTPGTYTITNTVSGGICPAVTATATVTITALPIANAGAAQNFICGTPTITIDGSASSIGLNIVYLWTTANGHIVSGATGTAPVVDSAGTYTITVTDTVSHCSASANVIVTGTPGPTAVFTANPTSGNPPLTVTFTNLSTGGTSYLWSFGTGDTSSFFSPTYVYVSSNTYTVTLVVSDLSGCSDTATATVIVSDAYSLVVSNVFTPNGDGVNDLFVINSTGVQLIEGDIYDRWGVKLFTWHADKEGWDGRTISGQQALAGTYFYVLKTVDTVGVEHEDKGFFMLVR